MTDNETKPGLRASEYVSKLKADIDNCIRQFSSRDTVTPANADNYWTVRQLPYVWWGRDNLYPQRVLDIIAEDNVLKNVTNAFVRLLVSKGFVFKTGNAERLFKMLDCNTLLGRIAWDLVALDGFSVEVYNDSVLPGTRTRKLKHIPFRRVRQSSGNLDGELHGYYSALEWNVIDSFGNPTYRVSGMPEYEVRKHLPYNRNYICSLWHDYIYYPNSDYYPSPNCESIMGQAEITGQAIKFHVNYLKNGVIGSIIINMPFFSTGDPTEDKRIKAELLEHAEKKWAGTINAGKPYFNLAEINSDTGQMVGATIGGFPNDPNDKRHLEMIKHVREDKYIGMGVPVPGAFGLPDDANAGKADVMDMAYTIAEFFNVSERRAMIEKFFNQLVIDNDIDDVVSIPPVTPTRPAIRVEQTIIRQEPEPVKQAAIETQDEPNTGFFNRLFAFLRKEAGHGG